MVDVVVNHVMVTSTTSPDYSDAFFKDAVGRYSRTTLETLY